MLVDMEKLKINLNAPLKAYNEIEFNEIFLNDNSLHIYVNDCSGLYNGDTINLRRTTYSEDNKHSFINYRAYIKNVNYERGYFVVDAPENKYHYVKSVKRKILDDRQSYIVEFSEPHNVFYQDRFLIGNNNEISLFNMNNELMDGPYEYSFFDEWSYDVVSSGTFLTSYYDEMNCDTCEGIGNRIYTYSYLPTAINQQKLIIHGLNEDNADNISHAIFKYNPFFYTAYTEDNKIKCYFWDDRFFDILKNNLGECSDIVRGGITDTKLLKENYHWNVALGLSSDENDTDLGLEDAFKSTMLDNIENSLIPEIIDMERLKYAPIIKGDNSYEFATGITLNFHFIKRKENDDNWITDTNAWWNGYDNNNQKTLNSDQFGHFVESKGKISDLLGYLNFTNNDVYYRKKKVGKSFIRLSFYNSKDVIEQKLLFYSTVFFDAGTLYGKYLKQLMEINSGGIDVSTLAADSNIVLCESGDSRVDSQILITNEYDRTKSSEGFNIYLFAEDHLMLENEEKTIYMKVEFNHAGNGKTIPMLMWPKNKDKKYISLTIDNFLDSLYIPVKIGYLNGRYIYYIPDADNKDGNISLILFEPKLDIEDIEDGED